MLILIPAVIAMNLFLYYMPKKITKIEMYTSALFATLFAALVDIYLDTKYHFYWYFDKGIDWKWLIVLLGGKPSFTIIYLNFFPFYSKPKKKVFYIIVWSFVVTIMEIGAVYIGKVLHYDEWKLWYSAALYPLLLYILYLNGLFVKKLLKVPKKLQTSNPF